MKFQRELPTGHTKFIRMDGFLAKLLDGFQNAVEKHNTSIVMIIDGKSGLGKSTLSNQIAMYLNKKHNIGNLFFEPEAFLEGLADAKRGDVLIFDEAMLLSSRSSLTKFNIMVIQAMSMIRSKNIYIIFNVNSIFDLDKNLSIFRSDLLIHLYGDNLIDRGKYVTFFKALNDKDRLKELYLRGKKYYDYSKPKGNFVGGFGPEFCIDETQYEDLKQQGVNNFLKGNETKAGKAVTGRNNCLFYLMEQYNYTKQQVADIADLTLSQIQRIVRERPEKDAK